MVKAVLLEMQSSDAAPPFMRWAFSRPWMTLLRQPALEGLKSVAMCELTIAAIREAGERREI